MARKLVEIVAGIERVQDGRIDIELVDAASVTSSLADAAADLSSGVHGNVVSAHWLIIRTDN